MKIAVLGAQGQLGRDLCPRLSGEVLPLTRADLDLEKPETIAAYFTAYRPDVFINCSAYNFVDTAETDPDAAFRVNAWGVRALAEACRDFLHVGIRAKATAVKSGANISAFGQPLFTQSRRSISIVASAK